MPYSVSNWPLSYSGAQRKQSADVTSRARTMDAKGVAIIIFKSNQCSQSSSSAHHLGWEGSAFSLPAKKFLSMPRKLEFATKSLNGNHERDHDNEFDT